VDQRVEEEMIADLLSKLGDVKTEANGHYKRFKELKESEDSLKAELLIVLQETGLKSAKGEKYSVSMAQKTDFVINHEQSVIDWLKDSPEVESDAYIGLKLTPFKTLAKEILKTTGEVVPGTDLVTSEYLTVKENK
jgi:hypothetical protein